MVSKSHRGRHARRKEEWQEMYKRKAYENVTSLLYFRFTGTHVCVQRRQWKKTKQSRVVKIHTNAKKWIYQLILKGKPRKNIYIYILGTYPRLWVRLNCLGMLLLREYMAGYHLRTGRLQLIPTNSGILEIQRSPAFLFSYSSTPLPPKPMYYTTYSAAAAAESLQVPYSAEYSISGVTLFIFLYFILVLFIFIFQLCLIIIKLK